MVANIRQPWQEFLFDSHEKERVVDQHILADNDSNAPLKGSLV